jgi:hypothetical protein
VAAGEILDPVADDVHDLVLARLDRARGEQRAGDVSGAAVAADPSSPDVAAPVLNVGVRQP